MADTEPGFVIDGATYDFPTLDSLDLDEAELLYLATGLGLEDFVMGADDDSEDVARKIIRPTTLKALARIAYSREHPDVDKETVLRIAGKANASGALESLLRSGDDEVPPSEEPTQNETPSSNEESSSGNGSADSPSASTGNDSTASSDEQDAGQQTTLTPESVTSPGTQELLRVV